MPKSSRLSRRSAITISGLSAALAMSVVATGASAAPKPVPEVNNASCPTTPGVTPSTINYGYISSRTGPASNTFSGTEEAARLRVSQENAKGGVNGRKIIFKGYDDQTNPSTQVTVMQQAIGDNNFGVSTATSTVSGYPTLKDQGIPVTGFNAQAFGQDRNAFGVTGPTLPPGIGSIGLIQKMQKLGVTRLANINHASAGATASGNNTSAAIKLVPGLTESLR
ncbi:MAG: ABC transporter substrate-binding protein, partial [Actinobacteria bacterium]|nr:ABC transporter substrate-binding protein [Actinomycetota bacterium]